MKEFLLKLEPVIWLLFGQGILLGTMLLTGWILVIGILMPLGIVDSAALSYERAHMLGSNGIGRVVLAALIALSIWKGAHHTRHISIDFAGGDRDTVVASLLYLVATVGTMGAILAVARL